MNRFGRGAIAAAVIVGALVLATPAEAACTPEQQQALQAVVNEQCKGEARACKGDQDCETLKKNRERNLACADARKAVNDTCFNGGDPGHQQAEKDARNAVTNCDALIKRKGC